MCDRRPNSDAETEFCVVRPGDERVPTGWWGPSPVSPWWIPPLTGVIILVAASGAVIVMTTAAVPVVVVQGVVALAAFTAALAAPRRIAQGAAQMIGRLFTGVHPEIA